MSNKSAIPFWSIDAFLYLVMSRSFDSKWSSELLSRASTFIDSYILFEKVVLPERYKKKAEIEILDPKGRIFEFIDSGSLIHSDELTKGISIDLSLNFLKFEELEVENYKWLSQHIGHITQEEYESIMKDSSTTMAQLRLWQMSLLNEISDLTNSTSILPLSLQNIDTETSRIMPFQVQKTSDLDLHYQQTIRSISASLGEPFTDYIENIPPFFTLWIDQSLSNEHSFDVLIQLRRDFEPLRDQGSEFKKLIASAPTLRGKKEIIDEWNYSWETLHKGDFKKPQFLRKKMSSAEVSKAIVKPQSAGISSIVQSFLEYREESKAYKRFRIYGELYNELDGIEGSREKLKSKFSVDLVNII